jgi:hypothetical protein
VSGYLIPTLFDYGERDLAFRLADWLLTIQKEDGSFPDMEGQSRSFDTAACMEGLSIACKEYRKAGWMQAAQRARTWLKSLVRLDGAVLTMPGHNETHLYTMRVSWMIGSKKGAGYWKKANWDEMRTHYAAYALEGLWNIGEEEFVRPKLIQARKFIEGLAPYWSNEWWIGRGCDVCASAQLGILFIQAGIPAEDMVEATLRMVREDGSVMQFIDNGDTNSWTAKWCLDLWKLSGRAG